METELQLLWKLSSATAQQCILFYQFLHTPSKKPGISNSSRSDVHKLHAENPSYSDTIFVVQLIHPTDLNRTLPNTQPLYYLVERLDAMHRSNGSRSPLNRCWGLCSAPGSWVGGVHPVADLGAARARWDSGGPWWNSFERAPTSVGWLSYRTWRLSQQKTDQLTYQGRLLHGGPVGLPGVQTQ